MILEQLNDKPRSIVEKVMKIMKSDEIKAISFCILAAGKALDMAVLPTGVLSKILLEIENFEKTGND